MYIILLFDSYTQLIYIPYYFTSSIYIYTLNTLYHCISNLYAHTYLLAYVYIHTQMYNSKTFGLEMDLKGKETYLGIYDDVEIQ